MIRLPYICAPLMFRGRTPQGPAQVLLALIERKPSVVQDLLGKL